MSKVKTKNKLYSIEDTKESLRHKSIVDLRHDCNCDLAADVTKLKSRMAELGFSVDDLHGEVEKLRSRIELMRDVLNDNPG